MRLAEFFTPRSPPLTRFHTNARLSAIRAHSTCRKAGPINVNFTFARRSSPPMGHHILIIDDDPVQRRLLEAVITRAGMAVVTAPGGQPALDLLHGPRGDHIGLILLDLVMP